MLVSQFTPALLQYVFANLPLQVHSLISRLMMEEDLQVNQ